jgi:hypothetical protein
MNPRNVGCGFIMAGLLWMLVTIKIRGDCGFQELLDIVIGGSLIVVGVVGAAMGGRL